MRVKFVPLTYQETLQHYPRYAREDIQCFLIVMDALNPCREPVGLYGLIDRGVDSRTGESLGEGFLTIFPAFRYRVLSQYFFTALFDHALSCGFTKVYTWTRLPSWQKLFQRFETLGIQRLEHPPMWDEESEVDNNAETMTTDPKVWFSKRKDG